MLNIGNLKRFVSERLVKSGFTCISCGRCCKNRGIELTFQEIKTIATYLKIDINEFQRTYIKKKEIDRIKKSIHHNYRIKKEAYFLKIVRNDGICVFNEMKGEISRCKIYPVRPNICQLFPFTWEYLHKENGIYIDFSDNAWNDCKGILSGSGKSWEEIRDEITAIVIISLINALESGGIEKL
ncbi:MAG: YkgJ family cysteine cluster protein [Candidatus Lokiarchaeota archaeon]|nr:YkgJ family cysteine cluster protein [Candidatus Lokiarchaeota archaeon]